MRSGECRETGKYREIKKGCFIYWATFTIWFGPEKEKGLRRKLSTTSVVALKTMHSSCGNHFIHSTEFISNVNYTCFYGKSFSYCPASPKKRSAEKSRRRLYGDTEVNGKRSASVKYKWKEIVTSEETQASFMTKVYDRNSLFLWGH